MQIINSIPFSAASIIASFENLAGTNITEVFALVSETASLTELKTGRSKCSWPPFPGVTPPTIFVQYAIHCSACIVDCEPVKP